MINCGIEMKWGWMDLLKCVANMQHTASKRMNQFHQRTTCILYQWVWIIETYCTVTNRWRQLVSKSTWRHAAEQQPLMRTVSFATAQMSQLRSRGSCPWLPNLDWGNTFKAPCDKFSMVLQGQVKYIPSQVFRLCQRSCLRRFCWRHSFKVLIDHTQHGQQLLQPHDHQSAYGLVDRYGYRHGFWLLVSSHHP